MTWRAKITRSGDAKWEAQRANWRHLPSPRNRSMKKTVLIFGLIAGAILSAMMLATMPFMDTIGFDRGEIIGYTTMVAAFLLIFFGVRSYRDNVAGGTIRFGRAFMVGALIAMVASVCYVVTWQVIFYKVTPDFAEKYQAHLMEEARAEGASEAELAEKRAELDRFAEMYRNPAINAAITFVEPLPVGLLVALLSAAVLSRRRPERSGIPAASTLRP
jgi:cation transport ATPase